MAYIPNDELQYIVDNSQIICVEVDETKVSIYFESKRLKYKH